MSNFYRNGTPKISLENLAILGDNNLVKYPKTRLIELLHFCGKEPEGGRYGLLLMASAVRVLDYFEKGNVEIMSKAELALSTLDSV